MSDVVKNKVTIYHNARCSKSRATLALLEGHDVTVIDYLKEPPSADRIAELCNMLKLQPMQLIRVKEKAFAELALTRGDRRSAREWCKIMHENPVLIERPIVVVGKRAVIGRPPENVLGILGG